MTRGGVGARHARTPADMHTVGLSTAMPACAHAPCSAIQYRTRPSRRAELMAELERSAAQTSPPCILSCGCIYPSGGAAACVFPSSVCGPA